MFLKFRLLGLYFALFSFSFSMHAADGPKVVEALTAKPTQIKKTVKLIGTLKAKKQAHISSSISGVVQAIDAKDGLHVKKGTLLVHLRNDELRQAYELAKANAKVAKQQHDRMQKLYATQDVSKEVLEDSQTKASQANIAVSIAKAAFDQSEFRAPFDGTCGVFRVSVGSYVKTGDELVAFFDPKELMLEFSVPQKLISKIDVGSNVTVFQHHGKVVSMQKAIDPTTHMGLANATVGECKDCLIGSHVDVSVVSEKRENVMGVPDEALFLRDGVQHLYVVRNNKAVLVPVEVGLRGDALVEVTKGIAAGDVVVTRGRNKLFEGVDVKVHS